MTEEKVEVDTERQHRGAAAERGALRSLCGDDSGRPLDGALPSAFTGRQTPSEASTADRPPEQTHLGVNTSQQGGARFSCLDTPTGCRPTGCLSRPPTERDAAPALSAQSPVSSEFT